MNTEYFISIGTDITSQDQTVAGTTLSGLIICHMVSGTLSYGYNVCISNNYFTFYCQMRKIVSYFNNNYLFFYLTHASIGFRVVFIMHCKHIIFIQVALVPMSSILLFFLLSLNFLLVIMILFLIFTKSIIELDSLIST